MVMQLYKKIFISFFVLCKCGYLLSADHRKEMQKAAQKQVQDRMATDTTRQRIVEAAKRGSAASRVVSADVDYDEDAALAQALEESSRQAQPDPQSSVAGAAASSEEDEDLAAAIRLSLLGQSEDPEQLSEDLLRSLHGDNFVEKRKLLSLKRWIDLELKAINLEISRHEPFRKCYAELEKDTFLLDKDPQTSKFLHFADPHFFPYKSLYFKHNKNHLDYLALIKRKTELERKRLENNERLMQIDERRSVNKVDADKDQERVPLVAAAAKPKVDIDDEREINVDLELKALQISLSGDRHGAFGDDIAELERKLKAASLKVKLLELKGQLALELDAINFQMVGHEAFRQMYSYLEANKILLTQDPQTFEYLYSTNPEFHRYNSFYSSYYQNYATYLGLIKKRIEIESKQLEMDQLLRQVEDTIKSLSEH